MNLTFIRSNSRNSGMSREESAMSSSDIVGEQEQAINLVVSTVYTIFILSVIPNCTCIDITHFFLYEMQLEISYALFALAPAHQNALHSPSSIDLLS